MIGITGHSSVFDADTGLLYVLPVDLGEVLSSRLYVLDVKISAWNRLSFDNSVRQTISSRVTPQYKIYQ